MSDNSRQKRDRDAETSKFLRKTSSTNSTSNAPSSMSAVPHLQKQLKELTQHPLAGFRFEVGDDLFTWTVWFSGPADTLYYPGQYRAQMTFPQEFPFKPPEFRILSSFWHPNVYDDGRVCISILHAPGTDERNTDETAAMRWTPIQSIDKVLLSIISLLGEPDPGASKTGAPANVEALSQFRNNNAAFVSKCKANAKKSLSELPKDFVAPLEEDVKPQMQISTADDGFFFEEEDGDLDDDEESPAKKEEVKKPAGKYADELEQVRAMGVGTDKSDDEILALLTKHKGDLSPVIDACC